jgi:hypothetical protein
MNPEIAEPAMNAEEFSFQEDLQESTFFCLEAPPHSETSDNRKGKGKEISREDQGGLCSICFPHNKAFYSS